MQLPHDVALDLAEALVPVVDRASLLSGSLVALDQVFSGGHFDGCGLDGFGERVCHVATVEPNRPVFNRVLTDPQTQFNMGLKQAGAHSYRTQSEGAPQHKNGPDTATPTSQAGPNHQVP